MWVALHLTHLYSSFTHPYSPFTHPKQASTSTLAHVGGLSCMEVSSGDLIATAGYIKRMGQLMPDNVVKVCWFVLCCSTYRLLVKGHGLL
jgi:hypothetical protein